MWGRKMSVAKIILGTLACMVVAMVIIFIMGGGSALVGTLGPEIAALVVMMFLLLPLTELSYGSWYALVAWIAGGFIGGLVCADYKRAVVMAVLSVVLTVALLLGLASVILAGYGISITDLLTSLGASNLAALLPDLLVSMIIIAAGGVLGAMITKRRARPPAYAPPYAPSYAPPPQAPAYAPPPPTASCPNCGAPISPGLAFCTNCGRKLQ